VAEAAFLASIILIEQELAHRTLEGAMSAQIGLWLTFPLMLLAGMPTVAADTVEDDPATHNMLVFGNGTVFLSHLPMFEAINRDGTDYTSPHRYQVILQVTFHRPFLGCFHGLDITSTYRKDREGNPDVKMYTLNPEPFVLPELFMPLGQPSIRCVTAKVFRGHLERGGQPISGLDPATVQVDKVVYARKFDPNAAKLRGLTYILFGNDSGLFLAHLISKPPDFDQIIAVTTPDHHLNAEEFGHSLKVVLEDRPNTSLGRLKPGEPARMARVTSLDLPEVAPFALQVQPGTEYYFEEGELAVPPTFEQTDEERRSGF